MPSRQLFCTSKTFLRHSLKTKRIQLPALTYHQLVRAMSHGAMSQRLTGRTILITGASSGIGQSTAREFAAAAPSSLRLILTARRLDRVQALAEELTKAHPGVKCLPVKLDMTDRPSIARFVDSLEGEWRAVDCLVNNAGMVLGVDKAPGIKPEDIDTMLATNVTGLIQMTQSVLKLYRERAASSSAPKEAFPDQSAPFGDIVNVGSIAGREGYPGGAIYCATKAAVRSFTDALRKELIDTRIRVMEIDPGQVETEFSVIRFRGDKSAADKVYEGCEPLTPDDIAELIVFMVGRRQNVVVADTLVFPSHQAAATVLHRKTA